MDFTIIEKGFNHQTDRKTIRKIVQKSIDRLGVFSNFHRRLAELRPIATFIELDDGKIYRKALYLMVKTMVSG